MGLHGVAQDARGYTGLRGAARGGTELLRVALTADKVVSAVYDFHTCSRLRTLLVPPW